MSTSDPVVVETNVSVEGGIKTKTFRSSEKPLFWLNGRPSKSLIERQGSYCATRWRVIPCSWWTVASIIFAASIWGSVRTNSDVIFWIGLVLSITIATIAWVKWRFYYIKLSLEGVYMRRGLFDRNSTHISYEKASDYNLHDSIILRIFKVGSPYVDTPGGTRNTVVSLIKWAEDVLEVCREMAKSRTDNDSALLEEIARNSHKQLIVAATHMVLHLESLDISAETIAHKLIRFGLSETEAYSMSDRAQPLLEPPGDQA